MKRHRIQMRRIAFATALIVGLLGAVGAGAQTEDEIQAKRDYWQQKFRSLRYNKASHLENAARMKYAHEQSQLSNYPRGGERERLLVEWKAYLKKADQVQREIDAIWDQARADGVPPGWLYEVEDEPIVLENTQTSPAALRGDEDDDGRNPLYRDDDDD